MMVEVLFASIVTICSSFLSILGGLFIIYTYSAIPAVQNSTRKLLVCLTIADIATAYGNMIGSVRIAANSTNDAFCVAQSFVTTMSSLCSFAWTSLIALHLLILVICNGRDTFQTSKMTKLLFHLFGWGLPGIITVITLSDDKLGEDKGSPISGGWCWIRINGTASTDTTVWALFSGKGWEIFTYLFTTNLYILLKVFTIRKRKREPNFDWSKITSNLRKEDENFCLAFMVLYLVRLWGTIRFFLFVFSVDTNRYTILNNGLIYLHSYGDSAQAFWNCIIYCVFDKTVLCFVLPCCHSHEHNLTNVKEVRKWWDRKKDDVPCYKERAMSMTQYRCNERAALIGKIRATV